MGEIFELAGVGGWRDAAKVKTCLGGSALDDMFDFVDSDGRGSLSDCR